jgi:hypothetical protein
MVARNADLAAAAAIASSRAVTLDDPPGGRGDPFRGRGDAPGDPSGADRHEYGRGHRHPEDQLPGPVRSSLAAGQQRGQMSLFLVDHRRHDLLHVGQIGVDPVGFRPGDRPFEVGEPGVELWLQPVEQVLQCWAVTAAAPHSRHAVACLGRGVLHRLRPRGRRGLPEAAGRAIEFGDGVMKPADLTEKPLGELQRLLCFLQRSDPYVGTATDDHESHQREQQPCRQHAADRPPGQSALGDTGFTAYHSDYSR